MSDREAFVAAIAASPADDLPRLVFADWLEENGDPERADFIRLQIAYQTTPDPAGRNALHPRATELFSDHWQRWFRPFLLALDPQVDPNVGYEVISRNDAADTAFLRPHRTRQADPTRIVTHVYINRGFPCVLGVHVGNWRERSSLGEAFRIETPHILHCRNGLHSPDWKRFTDPSLRRIERLTMAQEWAWNTSAPESSAILDDPHLAGVRFLTVYSVDDEMTDSDPLPAGWVDRLVRSPLAYRLTGLSLLNIAADGMTPLCQPGRLHLERLELGGEITTDGVRRLGISELAGTVRELKLDSADLRDGGVAALARDNWRKLTCLRLPTCGLSSAVLPALASAVFTPQLAELDLSENRLFFDQPADLNGLRALAEVLDPERLVHLNLTNTGLAAVPDFLAERFGDRVSV